MAEQVIIVMSDSHGDRQIVEELKKLLGIGILRQQF